MTERDAISQRLRDLLFEIESGREAKFLLCVCDDRDLRREVRKQLTAALHARMMKVASISARNIGANLLSTFSAIPQRLEATCINLWGLPSMRVAKADQIFAQLNFHRDALTSFSLPILVWLNSIQVQRLASKAPDFWSRRTAVYFFDKPSARKLMERLFARDKRAVQTPPSKIARAFEDILSSEKKLGNCVKRDKQFSVEEADHQITALESNLEYLITRCREGEQLNVAIWLWNSSELDSRLLEFVNSMEPEIKNTYEYVYTDRAELMLSLALQMPKILEQYGKSVREKVRQRRRANILKFFESAALKELRDVLTEISARESRALHVIPALVNQAWPELDLPDYEAPMYEEATNAAYDLECWLSGYGGKLPQPFSHEDGRLLKALYSESSDPEDIAPNFGLTVKEIRKRIQRLKEKVEGYLSGKWLAPSNS